MNPTGYWSMKESLSLQSRGSDCEASEERTPRHVPWRLRRAPFMVTGAAALLAALYGLIRLPETRTKEQREASREERSSRKAAPAASMTSTLTSGAAANRESAEDAAAAKGREREERSKRRRCTHAMKALLVQSVLGAQQLCAQNGVATCTFLVLVHSWSVHAYKNGR